MFRPSRQAGYAQSAAQSAHPELWRGLKLAILPALGSESWNSTNTIIRDLAQGYTLSGNGGSNLFLVHAPDLQLEGTTTNGNSAFLIAAQIAQQVLNDKANTFVVHKLKTDATLRNRPFFNAGNTSETARLFIPDNAGNVIFDYGGAGVGQRLLVSGLTVGDDTWVARAGPQGLFIWQNGQLVGSYTAAAASRVNTSSFRFGSDGSGSDPYRSRGILVYNRELSEQEVRILSADMLAPFILARPYYTVPSMGGTETDLDASSSLSFSHDADTDRVGANDGGSTVTFTHTAGSDIVRNLDASSTVSFGQTLEGDFDSLDVESTVTFTGTADVQKIRNLDGSSSVTFTQGDGIGKNVSPLAEDWMALTHAVHLNLRNLSAQSTITFADEAGRGLGHFYETTPSTITFSVTTSLVKIKSTAITLDAESTITFGQIIALPKEIDATSTVEFTQTAGADRHKELTSTIEFGFSADVAVTRALGVTTTVSFNQAFGIEHLRGIVQHGGGTIYLPATSCPLDRYAPQVGGGSIPGAPTPPSMTRPTLVKRKGVQLWYPWGDYEDATHQLDIRGPDFGDRDRLAQNRINRESRGGTLQIYRDPKWPTEQVLSLTFNVLSEEEGQAALALLRASLGKEIGFLDWNTRLWKGIINNPDAAITRNRRDSLSISIEIDVINQDD